MRRSCPVTDDPQSFDRMADAYDRYATRVDEPVWPWLSSPEIGAVAGGRALDAGCGSGRRCVELAAHFTEVVGIDVSRPLVELAGARHAHSRVRYEVADLATFSDPDGFDLVHSWTTLHHVDPLEPALANLRSLVRPGGMAVLVDPVQSAPAWVRWLWRHGGFRLAPLDQVPARLRSLGLRDTWQAYRFEISRPWVAHLRSDRFLRRPEFHERYLSVFPEGHVVDFGLAALVWRR